MFKVVLRFREAFWQSDRFLAKRQLDSDRSATALNFIHAEQEDVPVWWTALPSQAPLLPAWVDGPKAEALLSDDEELRIHKTVAALSREFGVSRQSIDELLESLVEPRLAQRSLQPSGLYVRRRRAFGG